MSRIEFKQSYSGYYQGLFIVMNPKRLPKDQPEINIGQAVSDALCQVPRELRKLKVIEILENALQHHDRTTITHIEVLFADYLEIDVVRSVLSLCRNRIICCLWPGQWHEGKLIYATPEYPEYYECDIKALSDLYIVND